MDVHASPAEWPELKDVLGALQVRFRRPEGGQAGERYLTGRLTELPHKHSDTMAQAVPGSSEQRWQEFLTTRQWEAADLNRQWVDKMTAEATLSDGVLGLDDTGFPQQGKTSVGVTGQDSGTLGKVGHDQSTVTCGDPEPQTRWPVAVRWYLPQAWAEALEPRGNVRVPDGVTCQTTPEMALARFDQARAWGVPHRCGVADASDGDTPHVLAAREARQERSVMGVCVDCRVRHQRQATSPSRPVDQRLRAWPCGQWRTLRWRQGTTGWRRKKWDRALLESHP
jgi:SRSO17 transposase